MPANPGLMLRLITMTVWALSTSRMGMPYIGLREIAVDLVHLNEAVVGDVRFSQQHVHMPWHASRDGMDGEANFDSLLGKDVIKFANLVLRLRHRHPVAGDDHNFIRGIKNRSRFFGSSAVYRLRFLAARSGSLHLTEGSEQDVGERPVHRLRHDDRENQSGRSVEGAC